MKPVNTVIYLFFYIPATFSAVLSGNKDYYGCNIPRIIKFDEGEWYAACEFDIRITYMTILLKDILKITLRYVLR